MTCPRLHRNDSADLVFHGHLLNADETPLAMLDPGAGKAHRAFLWTYCSRALQPIKLVVFDFAESRAGAIRPTSA